MHILLTLEQLLQINNLFYINDCNFVNIEKKNYSFVKNNIWLQPKQYYHSLYNIKISQSATYIIQEYNGGNTYVGSSGNIYKRISRHKELIKLRKHDNSNFNKLLKEVNIKTFEVIIIFTDSREEAYALEQLLVNHYKPTGRLLNIANDVYLARLGAKNTEEHNRCIREANLGRKHTDETKQLLSDFHKTDEKAIAQISAIHTANKRRVSVYGIEYDSVTQAGEQSVYSETHIRRELKNNSKHIFYLSDNASPLLGRTISEEHKNSLSNFRKTNEKAKAQFAAAQELSKKKIILNGVLYDSITDAVDKTGISETTIHRQLKLIGKCNDGSYVLNYTQPLTRKVSINGEIYDSTSIAANGLGIDKYILKNWIKSKSTQYKDYIYI